MRVLNPFLYHEVELPLVAIVAGMERAGYLIDKRVFEDIDRRASAVLPPLVRQLRDDHQLVVGKGADAAVATLLYETLGLPVIMRTKRGSPSTDAEALLHLAEHPEAKPHRDVINVIIRVRQLQHALDFCRLRHQVDSDGRLRVQFNQIGTVTGRMSSPSLMHTIPRPGEFNIRQAFRAADGHQIVTADYDCQEMRVLAHVSGDESLRRAFLDGHDLHGEVAVSVFNLKCLANQVKMKYPKQRALAKSVGFGLLYGGTAKSLSRRLRCDEDRALEIQGRLYDRYPSVQPFIAEVHQQLREFRYVDDMFGRRRHFPSSASPVKTSARTKRSAGVRTQKQASDAEMARQAQNFVIQAAAATITKLAMIRVDHRIRKAYPGVKLILALHDELQFEVPDDVVEPFAAELPLLMSDLGLAERFGFTVPLPVNVQVGPNMGSLKPLEVHS
jgi:DNA polymerase-1